MTILAKPGTLVPAFDEPFAPVQFSRPRAKPIRRIPICISGQDVPDCPSELVGIEPGTVYLRSERQIPELSAVVVSFDHIRLSGVVAGCQPGIRGWVISIALASCRRRLDERIPQGEES